MLTPGHKENKYQINIHLKHGYKGQVKNGKLVVFTHLLNMITANKDTSLPNYCYYFNHASCFIYFTIFATICLYFTLLQNISSSQI